MIKVFISYHHDNEQYLKKDLTDLNDIHRIFQDCSVNTNDIDPNQEPQAIRKIIRQNYLSESTVLLLLVGNETKYRKHVDWELYSSMHNGSKFGRSGVVVLLAPASASEYFTAPFDEIKNNLYPHVSSWTTIKERVEYERRYPDMPPRIIDNLVKGNSKISVTNWSTIIKDPYKLSLLIECAHNARTTCEYDMSLPMRMRDHNP